ncbi:MAG: hypothetical protein K6A23_06040 [Butyrivibrio sp.]|nr:hypothetical protein [Butyrivibrio sp.]
MIVLEICSLILWLFLVPFCMGLIICRILPPSKQTLGITFLSGYLLMFVVFEVISIPCMINLQYGSFTTCNAIFACVSGLLAMAGIVTNIIYVLKKIKGISIGTISDASKLEATKEIGLLVFPGELHAGAEDMMNPRRDIAGMRKAYSKEDALYWCLFALILLFQLFMAVTRASFDGDDAYYVTESLLAQQQDVMNTVLPYTGTSTSLDLRHALAVFTMWIAFIAKMSGIHATIVSHTIMPLLLIPMTYLIYLEIGRILLHRRQELLPIFMIIMSLIQMFGNVSIYTTETFFMTRTWQGKSMMGSFVIPLIIWLMLWIADDETGTLSQKRTAPWILLGLTTASAGIFTSMGVILGTGLLCLIALVLLIYTRHFKLILKTFLVCIPSGIYLLIYLFLHV